MTPPGNNRKNPLEEFLSGNSDLSRTYQQQAREEPSNTVDENLRAAARRELNSGPRRIINPFGRHWTVPVSLAALFLLSVGLVMLLSDETGLSQLQHDVVEEKLIEREFTPSTGTVSDGAGAAPALPAGPADRLLKKRKAPAKPAAASEPMDSGRRSRVDEPAPMKQNLRIQQDVRGLTGDKVAPEKTAAPALRKEMDEAAPGTKLVPELWLQKINALRKQGKMKEADASLAEFRKAYPHYPLDDLHK